MASGAISQSPRDGDRERPATAKALARTAAGTFHRILARQPNVAASYLRAIGWLTRPLPDGLNKQRLMNTLKATAWPDVALPDQAVRLGSRRTVRLVPHVGEFDFEALFCRELAYEPEVFSLLEERLDQYDAIVEIGANVGVFTTFFCDGMRRAAGDLCFRAFAEGVRSSDEKSQFERQGTRACLQ